MMYIIWPLWPDMVAVVLVSCSPSSQARAMLVCNGLRAVPQLFTSKRGFSEPYASYATEISMILRRVMMK